MSTSITPTTRRNRGTLLAIAGVFFGTLLVAGILRFSGWNPAATQAHGELLHPPGDLRALVPTQADGQPYRWDPAKRIWRIALAPPQDCADVCVKLAGQLATVWQILGQDSDRVHVLWIGSPPASIARMPALRALQASAELRAGLPRVAPAAGEDPHGVPVFVIDPNGFVILRYPPGSDPGGLRNDLVKLLKLM
jgi:cytochrome oxidase Cu insertion factor (SCO1/SenC/PrrC family)